MLDGQAQPARTGGAEHQPVRAAREVLIRESVAEQLVIHAKIVHRGTALRDAGGAAGFEYVDGLAGASLGNPAPHRSAAEPFVLEFRKSLQVFEAANFLSRIPTQFRSELQ